MRRADRGFTLIELMIVVVIIGILAAMAIPNFIAMQDRAKEGSTKSNMHTFQLAAEDYAIRYDNAYAADAADVAGILPSLGSSALRNPFDKTLGSGNGWVDQGSWARPMASGASKPGVVAYGDSSQTLYQVAGSGKNADFALILSSGQ